MPELTGGSFAYAAQTFDGQPMTGTIDAADLDDASRRLTSMRLRVIRIDPAQPPPRAKQLRGEDFAMFNQQLAHLSGAGLPIEQGLRLIAEDLRSGGLAQSIRQVSAELEQGVPLGEAFKRHEKQFPPLYGTIIEAGVRTGNLPAVLFNVGRHLDLVARLRGALWRSVAYPLTVLGGIALVMIFLGQFVLPQFQKIYAGWYMRLPAITQMLYKLADWTPAIIAAFIIFFIGAPLLWLLLRRLKLDRAATDLVLPLPLVGPILRRNLIARWSDAMRLAIASGMDLPASVDLASQVIGSPALKHDGERIITQINQGKAIDQFPGRLRIIPLPVLAVVQLSASRNDLPDSLSTISTMYQQQAEMRMSWIQTALTPTLIVLLAILIGFVVLGLFAPMISLFQSVM